MSNDWMKAYEEKHNAPAKRESNTKIISSSYAEIDQATGLGGLPLGKVIDIAGESNIGKSCFAQDLIAYSQRSNLACVYLDLDRKFDAEFAATKQVDLKDLLVYQPETVAGIVPACLALMENGLADLIIFDSVSNLPMMQDGENLALKTVINPLLQKLQEYNTSLIFLSQIRTDLVEGGDVTPRNLALNDLCNIRMMFKFLSTVKHEEVVIGHRIEVDIYKNDLASPAKTNIELFI
jgi:recombination protein RecA